MFTWTYADECCFFFFQLVVKLVAILPWITLLFTIIASVVIFISGSRASRTSLTFAAAVESNPDPTDEKYEKHDEVSIAAVA